MLIIDSNTKSAPVRPSIFLHGLTGCGKSTWAITGGRPLVILTEPKAASVLRQINPDAVGMAPESLKDLVKVFEILGQPDRLEARQIDRIILDSFTELTYSLPKWIKEDGGVASMLTRLELSEYGDLRDYALALVKAIQLTGYPSVVIARSTSKKIGREDRIVPDGMGKSINELPGKLLPTVEARFDGDDGYLIDSTPDECSQRCGLPWLPRVWKGSVGDFIHTVENGAGYAPRTFDAPDPEKDPEGYKDAFHEQIVERQAELTAAKPEPSQASSDFVDSLEPVAEPVITLGEFGDLTEACIAHKVPLDRLEAYCRLHGRLAGDTLNTLKREHLGKLTASIVDASKRRGLLAHLNNLTESTAA